MGKRTINRKIIYENSERQLFLRNEKSVRARKMKMKI